MSEKKVTRGMNLGRLLLWAAVIVSAPRWAGAMLAADVNHIQSGLSAFLNGANTVSGFGMGVLEVVATAYLLDALRGQRPTITVHRKEGNFDKPNWRFYGILAFAIGLLAMTPLVLAPYLVSRMAGEDIATVLTTRTWQYVWAITVVVVPVFVVGGVAFAQQGLVTVGTGGASATPGEIDGKSPEKTGSRRKVSAQLPEVTGPVYRDFRDVPEGEYAFIAGASGAAIVRRYRLDGKDPERTARNWRAAAKERVGERAASQQMALLAEPDKSGIEEHEGG